MKLIVKGAAAAALTASLSANAEPPEVSYADADGFFENGAGLAENLYRYLQFWASTAESANELQNIS